MAANLELIIHATDRATGVLRGVDKEAGGLSRTLGTGLALAGAAAAAGLGIAVVAGINFVKQAAEEEAGIKRLGAAVDANGGSWEKQGAAIEKVVQGRQKLAFSDDDLRSSLAMLTAQTGSVDEAMRRQVVAMDLARGANIDLGSASKLLGKVTDESHGALSRLGIVVDKNADATEVLAAVQQRFGGQAAAFADTATGKWTRFNIAVDNIKESIGAALLPIVTKLADKMAVFLEENQDSIDKFSQAFSKFASSQAFPFLIGAFTQLTQLIKGIMATGIIQWVARHREVLIGLAVALGVLVLAFGGPIPVIIALVAAGTILLANWDKIKAKATELWQAITDRFNAIIEKAKQIPILGEIFEGAFNAIRIIVETYLNNVIIIVDTAIKAVRDIIQVVTALIRGDWDAAWNGIKQLFSDIWEGIKALTSNNLNALKDLIWNGLMTVRNVVGDALGQLREFMSEHWRQIVTATLAVLFPPGAGLFVIVTHFGQIRDQVGGIIDSILGRVVGAFSGVGNAIAEPFAQARRVIDRVIDKVNELIDAINSIPSPGDIFGGIGGAVGGLIPRQHGGPVAAGRGYLVGERGAELFVPRSAGNIIPNGAMGGGNVTVTNHFHSIFAPTPADHQRLDQIIQAAVRRVR